MVLEKNFKVVFKYELGYGTWKYSHLSTAFNDYGWEVFKYKLKVFEYQHAYF